MEAHLVGPESLLCHKFLGSLHHSIDEVGVAVVHVAQVDDLLLGKHEVVVAGLGIPI